MVWGKKHTQNQKIELAKSYGIISATFYRSKQATQTAQIQGLGEQRLTLDSRCGKKMRAIFNTQNEKTIKRKMERQAGGREEKGTMKTKRKQQQKQQQ